MAAIDNIYIQNWVKLYKELCNKVATAMPEIAWQDLWHNQVGFLEDEHPFPTPALFWGFRIITTEDGGEKIQDATLQVDAYLFYETFNDTYHNSYNQDSALGFLDSCTKLYQLLHGTSGNSYSGMRRVGFAPVDTGSAGNLYRQSFTCMVRDLSAIKQFNTVIPDDVTITREDVVFPPSNDETFRLP